MTNTLPAVPAKDFSYTIVHGDMNIAKIAHHVFFDFDTICEDRYTVREVESHKYFLGRFIQGINNTVAGSEK